MSKQNRGSQKNAYTENQKRKRKKKRPSGKPIAVFIILIIAAAFAAVALVGYKFAYMLFDDVAVDELDTKKYVITLEEGEEDQWKDQIYDFLKENNLVDSLMVYKWREKLYSADYAAGTYTLRKSYTTEKIINILSGYVYSNSSGALEED